MGPVHRLRIETFKGVLKLSRKHSYWSKKSEVKWGSVSGLASGIEGRQM